MDDDEYQKLATDTYERINAQAAMVMLFSERLLAEEVRKRGDAAHATRMRNAYARLALRAKAAIRQYDVERMARRGEG